MELVYKDIVVPLPPAWFVNPDDPRSGLGPAKGAFRQNVVAESESPAGTYESIGAFAKRTFNALQSALDSFQIFSEGIVNKNIVQFRREYSFTYRDSTSKQMLRQIQYYFEHKGLFYSLTFSDADSGEGRQEICGTAAAIMTRVRLLDT